MQKTGVAAALALTFLATFPAHADDTVKTDAARSMSLVGTNFTASRAIAVNRLQGTVSNVSVQNLGNVATANGAAAGGAGASANGGRGSGGNGQGGDGSGGTGGSGSGSGGAFGGNGSQGSGAVGYGASVAGGGVGGHGAAGGTSTVDAGTLNLSNTLSATAKNAAGIVAISQNTGIGALTQQSINVQATPASGK